MPPQDPEITWARLCLRQGPGECSAGADGHVQLATSADGDTTKQHRLPSSVWRDEQGSHLDPVQLLTQPATQVGLSADKRFLLRGLEGALSMYSPRETLQSAGSMLQRVSAHRSQAGFDAAPPHQRCDAYTMYGIASCLRFMYGVGCWQTTDYSR